jgi:hypothetical protein
MTIGSGSGEEVCTGAAAFDAAFPRVVFLAVVAFLVVAFLVTDLVEAMLDLVDARLDFFAYGIFAGW